MKKILNHQAILWLLILLAPLSGLRAQYNGGASDGHAADSVRNITCGFAPHVYAYTGGTGDGHDVSTKTYTTCPTAPQYYAYIGGSGDGSHVDSLHLTTCAQSPQYYAYEGGAQDGHGVDSLRNTNCATPNQFYAYFGGQADGYAIDTLRNCPNQPPVAAFTVSKTTLCAGDTVRFSDTSSNSPFVYKWYFAGGTIVTSDTVARPVVRYNTAGVYQAKLVVRNYIGSDSLTKLSYITVNANPIVNLGPDTTICNPNTVTLNAANPGATYSWSTTASSQTISVNTTGVYSVAVTKNGCTKSDTISVTANPVPAVSLGNDTSICAGRSVTLNATTSGANYLWSTGSVQPTISVSATNTYSVAVTKNGCTGRDTIAVTVNPLPVVNLGNDTSVCTPNTVTLNAGNAGSTYLWSTTATTQSISTGATGSYTVTVTLPTGCSAAATRNVTAIQSPSVNLGNDTTFCAGGSTVLNAFFAGATYSWSTTAVTSAITVTASGTYTVTVTTGGLCKAIDTKVVTVTPLPVVNLGNDTSICAGNTVTIDAGNAGATYLWSNGATTQTISVSSSITATVTVTRSGCSSSDTKIVTVNPIPTVHLGNDTTICAGNSVVLNATNAGASYLWSTAATSPTIAVTATGTYSVLVSYAGGCTARDTIVVTVTPLPVVNLGNDTAVCAGSVILNAGNAGATYLWSTTATSQSITVSISGSYTVTVTRNGCSASDTKVVTVNSNPVVNLGNDTAICAGNSVVLNAGNAGATYLWSTNATTQSITVTTSGTYSVVATLTGGCTARDTIVVTVNPAPTVNLGNDTSICAGNSVVLNAGNAGATYLWSTTATTQSITVSTGGTYTVTVTKNGCSSSDTKIVTVNPIPVVHLGNDTAICAGNSVVLNATNAGATYLWSSTATSATIAATVSGTYSVQVSYAGGCTARDTIVVTVNPVPVVNLGNDTAICTGNSVVLNAGNAGAAYLWSTTATTQSITVSTGGTYTVTVTKNGCSSSDTKIVTVNPIPVVHLGNDTTVCAGNIVSLNAGNAGASYLWSTNATTQSINVTASGTYSVVATYAGGCVGRDTIIVTATPLPVVNLGNDTAICSGSVILNAANAGASYLWSTTATTQSITVSASGSYTVTVTRNGCSASDTKVVTVNSNPLVNLGPDTTICAGNSVSLNAGNAGATYLWSTNATTQSINVTASGTYSVVATLTGGCTARDTIVVTVTPLPVVNLGNDTSVCAGNNVVLNAGNAGATYAWSTTATSQSITVSASGTYTATVTRNGCSASDSKVVTVNALPIVQLGNDTTVCAGHAVLLNAGNTGSIYTWSTSSVQQTITATTQGTYSATVTDAHLCAAADSIVITVIQASTATVSATICPGASYTFGSRVLTQAGVYRDTLASAVVCDSIITLTLNLYAQPLQSTTAFICPGDSFTFRGAVIYQSGVYTDTLFGAGTNGCDSLVQLSLTVRPVQTINRFDTVCYGHSLTFGGVTVSSTGTYTDTVSASTGCDSINVLHLVVLPQLISTATAYVCQGHSYNFGGQLLTAAGVYTDTFSSRRGCDSIVTLTLTLRNNVTTALTDSICQGSVFTFHGRNLTQSGTYRDTLAGVNTCDSIVTLTLTVVAKPVPVATLQGVGTLQVTAAFASYQWLRGNTVLTGATSQNYTATQNGSYRVIVTNAFGCSDTSVAVSVTHVGIADVTVASLHIYPNPTENIVHIEAEGIRPNTTLILTDAIGRTVYETSLTGESVHESIDLSSYASGMYMVNLKDAEKIYVSQRIIKN